MVTSAKQAIPYFSAVWVFDDDAATYADNTLEARSPGGTAFTIFDATADFLYLGDESRFDLAMFLLNTAGSLGTLKYEYYNGTAWIEFVPSLMYQYTTGESPIQSVFDFTSDGAEYFTNLTSWTALAFSNSSPHTATVPDTDTRYWVRISSPTTITTSPIINAIIERPRAMYCNPDDVSNLLQLDVSFSSSTTPTSEVVEEFIEASQSRIDTEAQWSWRPNYQQNEHQEFELSGIKLARGPAWHITKVEIWNGASWESRTSGRASDYFLIPDVNMLHWSRYFILPARFQSVVSSLGWWGWGEFIKPVRISYFYGDNIHTDSREGRLVWDIARKMAAIDIFQSHDYSLLAVSGTDKVSLERKIENWKLEIERSLETITRWQVF